MIDLLIKNIYKKYNNYKFIDQTFLNNNKKIIHCFVAKKNKAVVCLLQSYNAFNDAEKNKAINDYINYINNNK